MKKYDINQFRAKDWYNLGYKFESSTKQIQFFKKAVRLDPLHGPAWHFLGSIYSRKGDEKMEKFCNQKALEAYKIGLQRYRRELTKSEWECQNENKKDDPMKTMILPKKTYDVLSEIDNEIDSILENLGRLYWNMNEFEKAVECYDKLIDLYPNWGSPHKSRGQIYNRLGNHEKAIDDLRFAVEIDDTDYESYYLLGKSYAIIGKNDRALWYFAKAKNAAEKSLDCVAAKVVKADSNYELQEYDESISEYGEILRNDPKNKFVWNKMGEALVANGEHKRAIKCFQKACKIEERKNSSKGGEY